MSDHNSSSDEVLKNKNYFEEIVPQLSTQQYMEHFRLSLGRTQQLAYRFADFEYCNWHIGDASKVSALKCVMMFLWFAANEAAFKDVSDRFNITKKKVEIEAHFRAHNFPGVIGVIDGTHIKIDKPGYDPDSYLNRKHFYSIQAQIVCNHRCKICDIFMGFPGSVHDSRVLRLQLTI